MKKQQSITETFCPQCGNNVTETVAKQVNEVKTKNKRSVILAAVISAASVILVAAIIAGLVFGTSKITHIKEDAMAKEAIELLTEKWEEIYEDNDIFDIETDKIIIIKNTRLIKIKDNDSEIFKDVDYVMEFILLSDYYGVAPYYMNIGIENFVLFYKDGTAEVYKTDPFLYHASRTYDYNFDEFVDKVTDLDDRYNRTIKID